MPLRSWTQSLTSLNGFTPTALYCLWSNFKMKLKQHTYHCWKNMQRFINKFLIAPSESNLVGSPAPNHICAVLSLTISIKNVILIISWLTQRLPHMLEQDNQQQYFLLTPTNSFYNWDIFHVCWHLINNWWPWACFPSTVVLHWTMYHKMAFLNKLYCM